ncbi:MAG: cell wall hydrolase [Halanaerobium sp.]|nr:cell wall hydrolase [Halanaerobium sp.]
MVHLFLKRKLFATIVLTAILLLVFNLTIATQPAQAATNSEVLQGVGAALLLIMLVKWFNDDNQSAAAYDRNINEDEVDLLAHLINGEARGEPLAGQIAVGAVVLNRINSPEFPNTMKGVIFQKGQFSCVSDGQFYLKPGRTTYEAAERALAGEDPSRGALYFYNPETASTLYWLEQRPITVIIGDHVFAR